MKERILALAKGKSNYKSIGLQLSKDELRLVVVSGGEVTDSFSIRNAEGTKLKGFICTDECYMPFFPVFEGEENEISFTVSAERRMAGEVMEGVFHIVTDCGQRDLPYRIDVKAPVLEDDKGVINDYYLLQERIKSNYVEGARLFHSEQFKSVFLFRDHAGTVLYQHLEKYNTKIRSMEEFLVAQGKKEPVRFSISRESAFYELEDYEIGDSLSIKVNTWGAMEIKVRSTHEAIIPECTIIRTDEFVGQTRNLSFVIDGKKIARGRQIGKIILESPYEKKEVIIEMTKSADHSEHTMRHHFEKNLWAFFKNLLEYELGRRTKNDFCRNLRRVMTELKDCKHPFMRLMRGYSLIIVDDIMGNGGETAAEYVLTLDRREKPESGAGLNEVLIYVFERYLKTLYVPDIEEQEAAAEEIRYYYENGYHRWELLYLLLKVDRRYDTLLPRIVWDEIEQFVQDGCHSPFLYIEALRVYEKDVTLLHSLNESRIRILHYGMKEGMLGKEFAVTLSFLAEGMRGFSALLLRCLISQYEKYNLDDTLHSICSLLIRNEISGPKYFHWFDLGVMKCLRITELFEYYMSAVDREIEVWIPQSVISYFQYENHLSDTLKAYLYARIVVERDERPQNFKVYREAIRAFALNKLNAGQISRDLGIIYEVVFEPEDCKEELAQWLPHVIFKHLLICPNSNIEGVRVVHLESGMKEEHYFLNSGRVLLDIYTPNYQLYFFDKEQHCYAAAIEHTLEPLMNTERFAARCFENGSNHPHLLIYLLAQMKFNREMAVAEAVLCDMAVRAEILHPVYQGKIMYDLYHYAKNHGENEFLIYLLEKMDFERIKPEQRKECISDLVENHLFEEAFEIIRKYGTEQCSEGTLLKLALWYVRDPERECTLFSQKLCYQLFRKGYREELITSYLLRYFMGTTQQLYEIYAEASARGLVLEEQVKERLLAQVLFVGETPEPYYPIYETYYQVGENRILSKAFLNYTAYGYVTEKYQITLEIFRMLQKESVYEENTIIILALLKYYSEQESLNEKQCKSIDYHISRLAKEGIIMKFMQRFSGRILLPYEVQNAYLVQYFTNSVLPVSVQIENGQGEISITAMRNIYPGIFVKELMIFEDEQFFYIIREEETGKCTQKQKIERKQGFQEKSFYSVVNEMSVCKMEKNKKGYEEASKRYKKYKSMASKLFRPL